VWSDHVSLSVKFQNISAERITLSNISLIICLDYRQRDSCEEHQLSIPVILEQDGIYTIEDHEFLSTKHINYEDGEYKIKIGYSKYVEENEQELFLASFPPKDSNWENHVYRSSDRSCH
jgi:hypothetical protein